MTIAIIDYGVGNPASVHNLLRKIGVETFVSSQPREIALAQKLILPGVGSFDYGMSQLKKLGLETMLNDTVMNKKTPILGICLGMQLMTEGSEEGNTPGLGWLAAETIKLRFPDNEALRVPHMGWNLVRAKKENNLLDNSNPEVRFYFVHSYHVVCRNKSDVLLSTTYGVEFTSAFQSNNIIGVQFHPEKSHRFGYAFLKNFAENFNG